MYSIIARGKMINENLLVRSVARSTSSKMTRESRIINSSTRAQAR